MCDNWSRYLIEAFPENISNEISVVAEILPNKEKVIIEFNKKKVEIIQELTNFEVDVYESKYKFNDMLWNYKIIDGEHSVIPPLIHNFNVFRVKLIKEFIYIPNRIYINEVEDNIIEKLGEIQKIIIYCLYTRHYNGYVRQKYIEKLLDKYEYFIIPYIVKMIGENVSEIMEIIEEYIDANNDNIVHFIANNLYYWYGIRGKISSNWNIYQKEKYPNFNKYIGRKLEKKINKLYNEFCENNKIENEKNNLRKLVKIEMQNARTSHNKR
jgi:hypothetical protein